MAAGRQKSDRDQAAIDPLAPSFAPSHSTVPMTAGLRMQASPSLLRPVSPTPSGSFSATPEEERAPTAGSSSSNRSRSAKDDDEPRPPRPPNAWMLYRSARFRAMESRQEEDAAYDALSSGPSRPKNKMAEVSRIISAMWRNEDPAVKEHYQSMADARKQEHLEMYPGYKYRPRKSRNAKPRAADEGSSKDAGRPIKGPASIDATPTFPPTSSPSSCSLSNVFLPSTPGAPDSAPPGGPSFGFDRSSSAFSSRIDGGPGHQMPDGWPAGDHFHGGSDVRRIQDFFDDMQDPSILSDASGQPRSAGVAFSHPDLHWPHEARAYIQDDWVGNSRGEAGPSLTATRTRPSGFGPMRSTGWSSGSVPSPFSVPASAPPSTSRFTVHPGSWGGAGSLDPQLYPSNVGQALIGMPFSPGEIPSDQQQQQPLPPGHHHSHLSMPWFPGTGQFPSPDSLEWPSSASSWKTDPGGSGPDVGMPMDPFAGQRAARGLHQSEQMGASTAGDAQQPQPQPQSQPYPPSTEAGPLQTVHFQPRRGGSNHP